MRNWFCCCCCFPLKQLPSIKKVCIYVHLKTTTLLNSTSEPTARAVVGWQLNNQVFSLDTPRTHFFFLQRLHFSPLLPSLLERAFMQTQQGGGRNVTCLQRLAFPPGDTLSCLLLGGTFLQLCLFRLVEPSREPLSLLMWEAIAVPGHPGTWRPSSIPPGWDLLGCHWAPLTRLFGGMNDMFSLSWGLPASKIRVTESHRPKCCPSQWGHCTLKKEVPGPQKWPVFQHCLPCISDAHYSLRATALDNLQPLPNTSVLESPGCARWTLEWPGEWSSSSCLLFTRS